LCLDQKRLKRIYYIRKNLHTIGIKMLHHFFGYKKEATTRYTIGTCDTIPDVYLLY
jgi:hypothetical protein